MVMAYNPEDVGSKPTTGNISIWSFYRNDSSYAKRRKTQQTQNFNYTGMAQRKRAGLITPRSLDRNGLPVLFINSHRCIKALAQSGSETINRVGIGSS